MVDYNGKELPPEEVKALQDLENLDLIDPYKGYKTIPVISEIKANNFGFMVEDSHIVGLGLTDQYSITKLVELPESFNSLKSLRYLDLSRTGIETFPECIRCFKSLEILIMRGFESTSLHYIRKVPEWIGSLKHIKFLDLSYHHLSSIPKSISELESLVYLNLRYNSLNALPYLGNLKKLELIDISENHFEFFPYDSFAPKKYNEEGSILKNCSVKIIGMIKGRSSPNPFSSTRYEVFEYIRRRRYVLSPILLNKISPKN